MKYYITITIMLKRLITAILLSFTATSAQAFTVTIEDPTVQSYPITNDVFIVDFNNQTLGNNGFSLSNGDITYTYSDELAITESSEWGGANSSQFITNSTLPGEPGNYKISINQKQKYFGFWWSAGDPYNRITFKNDGKVVAVLQTDDIVNHINKINDVARQSAYKGNPNGGNTQWSLPQIYTFVNVFFNHNGEAYDEIVVEIMSNPEQAGFESDNHTFSVGEQALSGTLVIDVPPAIVYSD